MSPFPLIYTHGAPEQGREQETGIYFGLKPTAIFVVSLSATRHVCGNVDATDHFFDSRRYHTLDLACQSPTWGGFNQSMSQTHHSLQNFSKDNMLAVQPWSQNCGDEELGAVGVFASVGHAEPAGAVVLQLEVLVRETVSINALAFKRKITFVRFKSVTRQSVHVCGLVEFPPHKNLCTSGC